MLRRLALVCIIGLSFTQSAHAETILHLSETATVMVPPDEIAATLRVEATSNSASDAQARVNTAMQDALAKARKVDGLTVSTGGYSVWRTDTPDHTERWQVSQMLNLTGHEGTAMLTLVGALQQHGLAVSNLAWRLSTEAERQAHQTATKHALAGLRGRVEEAAPLLDLRFDHYKTVSLDSTATQPMFRAMGAPMAMSAASAAPPTVAAEDVAVTATAEADAILLPR